MVAKQNDKEKDCVSLRITLCGKVLEAVKSVQKEYYNTTGCKLSKPRAIYKLILNSNDIK